MAASKFFLLFIASWAVILMHVNGTSYQGSHPSQQNLGDIEVQSNAQRRLNPDHPLEQTRNTFLDQDAFDQTFGQFENGIKDFTDLFVNQTLIKTQNQMKSLARKLNLTTVPHLHIRGGFLDHDKLDQTFSQFGKGIKNFTELLVNQTLIKTQNEMQTLARELNLTKVPSRIIMPSVSSPDMVWTFNSDSTSQPVQVELNGGRLIVNGQTVYISSSKKFMIIDWIVYDNKKPVYDLEAMSLLKN